MLRLRYIIASMALLTSGMFLLNNINTLTYAEAEQQEEDPVLENTFFTLNKLTSNIYVQHLAEETATKLYGPGVKVVIE